MTDQKIPVFLSYAKKDSEKAKRLIEALEKHNIHVWYWQDPQRGSERWIGKLEQKIPSVVAFIAFLSSFYFDSKMCVEERDLALRKEIQLHKNEPDSQFILAVKVSAFDDLSSGFLGSRHILDLTTEDYSGVAAVLAKQIRNGSPPERIDKTMSDVAASTAWPRFQNRQVELDLLTRNLTNPGGRHFWMIVAGPQMGKSWLLSELPQRLGGEWQGEPKYLDLKQSESSIRDNGGRLLSRLLGREDDKIDNKVLKQIVRDISKSKRTWLLMLDSAEWLDDQAARDFRTNVSKLYLALSDVGMPVTPLVVVIAGRSLSKPWFGVYPKPEFYPPMVLTHFKQDIVETALKDMAQSDMRLLDTPWYKKNALRLHRLSEGLPGLLVRYMDKLRDWQYASPEDLEEEASETELAGLYAHTHLLSKEALGLSLTQNSEEKIKEQQEALTKALSCLSTCRIFTGSHIKHAIEQDSDLPQLLANLKWENDDLLRRLQNIHLTKFSDELWNELDHAIRRLLFRHFHHSHETRLMAHHIAEEFYEKEWAVHYGTEQVVEAIESLWHRAEVIRLEQTGAGATTFLQFANKVLARKWITNGYGKPEFFRNLEKRLMADEELQESLQEIDDNLFDKLTQLVRQKL